MNGVEHTSRHAPSRTFAAPATERELCLRLGDRQGADGTGVHELVGSVCFELVDADSRNAMLVQLDSDWVDCDAFGRTDAGVRVDDHMYEHGARPPQAGVVIDGAAATSSRASRRRAGALSRSTHAGTPSESRPTTSPSSACHSTAASLRPTCWMRRGPMSLKKYGSRT